jgi:hypothetical protein
VTDALFCWRLGTFDWALLFHGLDEGTGRIDSVSNNAQHHKSDRAGESEVDWRKDRGRNGESALSRSDWVCWNVSSKNDH